MTESSHQPPNNAHLCSPHPPIISPASPAPSIPFNLRSYWMSYLRRWLARKTLDDLGPIYGSVFWSRDLVIPHVPSMNSPPQCLSVNSVLGLVGVLRWPPSCGPWLTVPHPPFGILLHSLPFGLMHLPILFWGEGVSLTSAFFSFGALANKRFQNLDPPNH